MGPMRGWRSPSTSTSWGTAWTPRSTDGRTARADPFRASHCSATTFSMCRLQAGARRDVRVDDGAVRLHLPERLARQGGAVGGGPFEEAHPARHVVLR